MNVRYTRLFCFLFLGGKMKDNDKQNSKMHKKWIIKKLLEKVSNGIIIRKIEQCILVFISFIKALKGIFINQKHDETYVSLAPTKNADKDGVYCDALKYAIDNTEIKNIAITGNYGSGKSSVIKTFFEKMENKKYNPIYVSLAAFNKNDYIKHTVEGEENIKEIQNKNEFYHTLEKSILQQLLYQANERNVPLSRFKRISKHSKILLNIETISVIFAIIILLCIIFPNIIEGFINNYNSIIVKIPKRLIDFLICVFLVVVYYVSYKILFYLSTKFNISKFKIKDAEVEIDDKPESIFNKYLDEIIYFFQVMNHSVVVIEDLDRYEGDASFIFQKLRELNTLINSSSQIKYEVNFIFAIRDDFFNNYEERTKFFDYIIPIIPISSNVNSNEIMWKRLEHLRNAEKINYKFDKNFIDDISIMIEDKRLIDNIINEFIIYKSKFNNEHMDDKQLFSIIMYKNICPKSYAELQKNSGNIVEIFKNKKEKVQNIIKGIREQQKILNDEKEKVIKECLNSVKELKLALVSSIYNYGNYNSYEREFKFDNEHVSIDTFINSNIDIGKISKSNIKFGTVSYSYIRLDENEVFKIFGNKSIFINRWETLEKGKELKVKEVQKKIEELDKKIKIINNLTIKELIKDYGSESIFDKNTKNIEKFLITKGYITEEYKDYITLFVPGNLTKDDNDFVFAVKTGEILPYQYMLNNLENILKKLNESDFETTAILNFDLLDYLISNDNIEKVLKLVHILDKDSEENLQFIDEFIEKYKSSSKFITILIENSSNLWKKIYKRIGNKEYVDKWVVQFLLDKNSLEYVDENFVEYINKHPNLDKYIKDEQIEVIISSLKILNIKMSNIQEINNKNFLEQILINNLYKLNDIMLKLFLKMNGNNIEEFEEKNLTMIMNCKNELKEYVLENFEEYFNFCYLLHKSNKDEERAIITILNNEELELDIRKQIIENEDFNEYKVEDLNIDLIDTIVDKDKIKISYFNILEIMVRKEDLPVNIINHISRNIDKYEKLNINECEEIYSKETIELFANRYIFNNDVKFDDFKILVKTFNLKVHKIEVITTTKLEYLIDNNLIEFNVDNFNYIKVNALHKLVEFIIYNIDNFIENIEEYEILGIENELLSNVKISKEYKTKIIENVDIEGLTNTTIIKLIFEGINLIDNENINKRILEDDNVEINDRLKILKVVLKNVENKDKGTEYIHLLQRGYEDINTSKNACSIKCDEIDIELCNILKTQEYISSYKKGKRNNIILYNKINRK